MEPNNMFRLAYAILFSILLSCAGKTDSSDVGPGALEAGTPEDGTTADAFPSGQPDAPAEGEAGPAGTPCKEPVHPYHSDGYTLDLSSTTTLLACVADWAGAVQPVRVDVEGSPVCPDLSMDCVQGGEPCTHECEADVDCLQGGVCVCNAGGVESTEGIGIALAGTGPNRCLPAECTSAADCGGWACGMSEGLCGGADGFYCRSANDACTSETDCGPNEICRYDSGHWACQERQACDNEWAAATGRRAEP